MSALDIDSVQTFLIIAVLRSFARAAAALNIRKSAVSSKLKKLGYRLVERTPRSVQLSAARELFPQSARDLLAAHSLARSAFGVKRRRIAIGFSNHLFGPEIPALPTRLYQSDPSLQLEMKVGTTREVLDALDQGQIGAAFVLRLDGTRLGGETIGQETFGWMASSQWSWNGSSPLPIAVQPSPCAVRAMAIGALEAAAIPWVKTFVGGGVATIGAAIATGFAFAAFGHRVVTAGCCRRRGRAAPAETPDSGSCPVLSVVGSRL